MVEVASGDLAREVEPVQSGRRGENLLDGKGVTPDDNSMCPNGLRSYPTHHGHDLCVAEAKRSSVDCERNRFWQGARSLRLLLLLLLFISAPDCECAHHGLNCALIPNSCQVASRTVTSSRPGVASTAADTLDHSESTGNPQLLPVSALIIAA
jgi:hypothetical protein